MKKLLCFFFTMALVLSLSSNTFAESGTVLSELSENECIEFIKQQGVSIPCDYDELTWAPFVKQVIETVEEDPYYEFMFNYSVTQKFANDIKRVVNEFYHINLSTPAVYSLYSLTNTEQISLQYSTPLTAWISDHAEYNCYVFALGSSIREFVDPGAFSDQNFSLIYTLEAIADLVEDDLQSMQYQRVVCSTEMDYSNPCSYEQIICLRRGLYDYHFMRLVFGEWHHKPGSSAILRYNQIPSLSCDWTNEGLFETGIREGNIVYDSEIYYFSVNGHDWEYTANNNGTHTKSCDICGDAITNNCTIRYTTVGDDHHYGYCTICDYRTTNQTCSFEYTGNGNNTHTKKCTTCENSTVYSCDLESNYAGSGAHITSCDLCDYYSFASCTGVQTYCGDETSTHVHGLACQDCGNSMSTTTTACTFSAQYAYAVNGVNYHRNVCSGCGYTKATLVQCIYKNSDNCILCGAPKDAGTVASIQEPSTAA